MARSKRALLIGPALAPGQVRWLGDQLKGSRTQAARDLVIAIDGGIDLCARLGLAPDLAVGDWDSLRSRAVLKSVPHLTLAQRKDFSDLAAALEAALELGAREIRCFGVTGGRPDHHLASLHELAAASASRGGARISAHDPEADYHFLSAHCPSLAGRLPAGTVVSVFAWTGSVRGLTLQGLKYPLRRGRLAPSSRGLSNQVNRSRFRIELQSGKLIVVIPRALR